MHSGGLFSGYGLSTTIFLVEKELNLVYVRVIGSFLDVNEKKWQGRFVRKTLYVVNIGDVMSQF